MPSAQSAKCFVRAQLEFWRCFFCASVDVLSEVFKFRLKCFRVDIKDPILKQNFAVISAVKLKKAGPCFVQAAVEDDLASFQLAQGGCLDSSVKYILI